MSYSFSVCVSILVISSILAAQSSHVVCGYASVCLAVCVLVSWLNGGVFFGLDLSSPSRGIFAILFDGLVGGILPHPSTKRGVRSLGRCLHHILSSAGIHVRVCVLSYTAVLPVSCL